MLGEILLVLTLAQAQTGPPTGSIRGQILVPSVGVAERILVLVQRADGPVVARIYTDVLGNYDVRNLPVGNYDVIVNLEGYEEVRQQVGIGTGAFNSVTLTIPLNEKEKFIVIKPEADSEKLVDLAELGRKYPKKAVQDFERAREEQRKGNDAKATELLEAALKLAPDLYGAHNTLGTLYQKSGRIREAQAEYGRARELNPRAPDPLVNLGSLYLDEATARAKEGRQVVGKILDDALDILEQALKIKRSATAYYFLGTAYYRSNFLEEAETNLKLALEMEPRLPAGHLMLANLYMKQRKWPGALEQLDSYLSENPKAADRVLVEGTRIKVVERIK